MPRKKIRRINGRRIENTIAKALREANKKWWVYRYNENRRNATPGDIQVQTPKFDVILEVKSSSSDIIYGYNIRKKQRDGLKIYHKRFKRNLGILVFYYNKNKKYFMIDIVKLSKLKGNFTYDKIKLVGYEVKDWGKVNGYFRRVYSRKLKISGRR